MKGTGAGKVGVRDPEIDIYTRKHRVVKLEHPKETLANAMRQAHRGEMHDFGLLCIFEIEGSNLADMTDWGEEAKRVYVELADYAAVRTEELSKLLQPYIETTDCYGELICRVILVLGQTPPRSRRDAALRDLVADVFDFLYEARPLIIKGKLELAYPLARRAYESLSLMVAFYLDPKLADRWIAGKKIGNAEVRCLLGKHPAGEPEEMTRELYSFFSQVAHPNRLSLPSRFLGEGNEFVLGAIGRPSLAMLADYALKTLNLWFWFGAFVHFVYLDVLVKSDPDIKAQYDAAAKMAQEVAPWLGEQFNRVLAQEQAREWKPK